MTQTIFWTWKEADAGLMRDQSSEDNAELVLNSGFNLWTTKEKAMAAVAAEIQDRWQDEEGECPVPNWEVFGEGDTAEYRWTPDDWCQTYFIHSMIVVG